MARDPWEISLPNLRGETIGRSTEMRITITLLMAGLLGSIGCSNQGTPATPAAGATSADLKQMVQTKLASDPQLAGIDVAANGDHNQVTLSGSAPSEQARSEAIEMAKAARADLRVIGRRLRRS